MVRPFLHAAGMFVLGLAGLLVVDGLHRARATSPVPAGGEMAAPVGTSGIERGRPSGDRRLAAVLDGLRGDLQTAAAKFAAGERRDGVAALDGAFRLAQVVSANLESASLVAMKIKRARTAVQDGSPNLARSLATEAADLVGRLSLGEIRTPAAPVKYLHALLLDAHGTVKGTVTGATANDVRVSPGQLAVFGIIGPRSADADSVPLSALLFGEPRSVGPTMVIDTGVR